MIDVRSQEACEQQDATFVGLIFTPFNPASKQQPLTQQLQLLAFKTDRGSSLGFRQLPISIRNFDGRSRCGLGSLSKWALDTLIELLKVIQNEEEALMANVTLSSIDSRRGTSQFLTNTGIFFTLFIIIFTNTVFTAYCYRLQRIMDEIGYPLISALESRLSIAKKASGQSPKSPKVNPLSQTLPVITSKLK